MNQSKAKYDLVYYCDSRPEIGNGHLRRGMDVLHALLRRRPDLRVALAGAYTQGAQSFLERFRDSRIEVFSSDEAPAAHVGVLDTMHRPGDPFYIDAPAAREVRGKCDTFAMISSSLEIDLPVKPDVFIDHLPDVEIRGEQPREVYVGFEYAPVADEFFEEQHDPEWERPGALVAVIGGGPDQGGPEVFARMIGQRALNEFSGFVIVVSPHYPGEKKQAVREAAPGVELVQGVPSLAPLLRSARAVVCTYGNITYESLSCGRPTFLASYTQFQDEYGQYLASKGVLVNFGLFNTLTPESLDPVFDQSLHETLAHRAKEQFNEPGITNIVSEIELYFDK